MLVTIILSRVHKILDLGTVSKYVSSSLLLPFFREPDSDVFWPNYAIICTFVALSAFNWRVCVDYPAFRRRRLRFPDGWNWYACCGILYGDILNTWCSLSIADVSWQRKKRTLVRCCSNFVIRDLIVIVDPQKRRATACANYGTRCRFGVKWPKECVLSKNGLCIHTFNTEYFFSCTFMMNAIPRYELLTNDCCLAMQVLCTVRAK